MGLVAAQHVGSSRTRAGSRVPCIGRRFLTTAPPGKPRISPFISSFIWYVFWSEVPKRDWVWFLLIRLWNHVLIKEPPLKKNLFTLRLLEHTVFAPSDVKSRAGSITHIHILSGLSHQYVGSSQRLLFTYCHTFPSFSLCSSLLWYKVPAGFGGSVPWPHD